MSRRRSHLLATSLLAAVVLAAGCSSSPERPAAPSSSSTTSPSATTATTTPVESPPILFSTQGGALDAYETQPPFTSQEVIADTTASPGGYAVNGQVCFFGDGSRRFVVATDDGTTAGWGVFELQGEGVGQLSAKQLGTLVATHQPSTDGVVDIGCAVLGDGRIVTTDVGNQSSGPGTGQLVVWFPPFDSEHVRHCKVDTSIQTAQDLWVDDQNRVYVTSARSPDFGGTQAGVIRYSHLPTSADASGGCGQQDPTGEPLADTANAEVFVAAGDHGLTTPAGIAAGPAGQIYVSSVLDGVINQYDENGDFIRTVLQPPTGETLGTAPFSTGTPLGLAVGPDGTLYYADLGLVAPTGATPSPGTGTGSVRRIVFDANGPAPPETMASSLAEPDGLGLINGGGSARSIL